MFIFRFSCCLTGLPTSVPCDRCRMYFCVVTISQWLTLKSNLGVVHKSVIFAPLRLNQSNRCLAPAAQHSQFGFALFRNSKWLPVLTNGWICCWVSTYENEWKTKQDQGKNKQRNNNKQFWYILYFTCITRYCVIGPTKGSSCSPWSNWIAKRLSTMKFKTFTYHEVKHSVIMADLQVLSWLLYIMQ